MEMSRRHQRCGLCVSGRRVADLGDWSSGNEWKVEGWVDWVVPWSSGSDLCCQLGQHNPLVYVFIFLLASLQVW